jgi:hypothetical protein
MGNDRTDQALCRCFGDDAVRDRVLVNGAATGHQ